MNDMPCVKQVRSPALRFHGDLIRLMAETCWGVIPTCQCQEAPNVSFGNDQKWTKRVDELSFLGQTFRSLWPFHNSLGIRSTNLIYWRRQWHPTPVFLPGESQGRRSLVGGRLWGRTGVGHDWSDLASHPLDGCVLSFSENCSHNTGLASKSASFSSSQWLIQVEEHDPNGNIKIFPVTFARTIPNKTKQQQPLLTNTF